MVALITLSIMLEGKRSSIIEQSESDWNEVIDINLKNTWLSMKYQIAVSPG